MVEEYEDENSEDNFNNDFVTPPEKRKEEENYGAGVIKALSPRKVLQQLRMNLKGFIWDEDEKKYVKLDGYIPLLNDEGISKYLGIMLSIVNDLTTFSSYSEEEVKAWVLYVCEKAIPIIHVNFKEYGIKEKSDLGIVDIQIAVMTNSAFKKAVGAGDRSVIGRTIQESIMTRAGNQARQEKKEGVMSRLNPFN